MSLQNEFDYAYQRLLGHIQLHEIASQVTVKTFELNHMPMVYNGSDIFILPSENETFGQVFIEAMACGVPVIGTKVGGIPEIINDGQNGYLVRPDDPTMLAQCIETLITDQTTRKQFIRAGLQTVNENFNIEKHFPAFFEMLRTHVS